MGRLLRLADVEWETESREQARVPKALR